MAGPITREHVNKIIKKLKAKNVTNANNVHDMWAVYHKGEVICIFGARRSSKKDKPHGHVPTQLRVNQHFTRELADCTKSLDQWLKAIGVES